MEDVNNGIESPKILELKHVEFDENSFRCVCPIAHIHETASQISTDGGGSDVDSPKRKVPPSRREGRHTSRSQKSNSESPLIKNYDRMSPRRNNSSDHRKNMGDKDEKSPMRTRHESAGSSKTSEAKKKVVEEESDTDTSTSTTLNSKTSNINNNARGLAGKSGAYISAHRAVNAGKKICGCILRDRLYYMAKPIMLIFCGLLLISGGVTLTAFHFMTEDSLITKSSKMPYFTYGPITLSTGLIVFMIGLVWFPIKQQKWKDGTASPIIAALERVRLARANIELGGLALTIGRSISKDATST